MLQDFKIAFHRLGEVKKFFKDKGSTTNSCKCTYTSLKCVEPETNLKKIEIKIKFNLNNFIYD